MPNEVAPRITRQRTDLCLVGGLPRTRDLVCTLQGGFLGKQDRMSVTTTLKPARISQKQQEALV